LDWELLGLTRHNLDHLEEFTEAKFLAVASAIAAETPGQDGYVGSFFKSYWNIINGDM
jgi:hypothetical protein